MPSPRGGAVIAFVTRFALIAPLLISWSLGTGRYGGPDEPAHVLRAYAAAHGDLVGDPAGPLPAGYRLVEVPAALASGDPACYRHDARRTSRCATTAEPVTVAAEDDLVRVATAAGLTPPLYHLAIGTAVRWAGDPADPVWYRVAASLLHAVVLALALTRARHRRLDALAVAAAVTPAGWFLFGMVNPNSLEIALALLCGVGVARLTAETAPTTADAWWFSAPAAIAVAVRPIALVAVLTMLVLIELLWRRAGPGRSRLRWILVGPVTAAVAAVGIWSAAIDLAVDDPRTAVHRSLLANLRGALRSLPTTAGEAVTSLGWNEFHPHMLTSVTWVVMWMGIILLSHAHLPLSACGVWLACMLVTPVAFEVTLAGSVGPIWQGRYSLPTLMALPALVRLDPNSLPPRRAAVAAVAAAAGVEVTTYWAAVRRYAVGTDGSWWLDGAFRSTTGLGPRPWLCAHIVIAAAASGALLRSLTRDRQAM